MQPETVRKIEEELAKSFLGAGMPLKFESVRRIASVFGNDKDFQLPPNELAAVAVCAGFLVDLQNAPEPSSSELERSLQVVRALPYLIKHGLDDKFRKMLTEFPRTPGSGRRKELNQNEEQQLIKCVQGLLAEGKTKGEAYLIAAQRFGIGKRTAQRYFAERGKIMDATSL
jgi:hypothetical protein